MERRPVGMLPVGLLAVGAVIYSLVPGGSSPGPDPRSQLAPEAGKEPATAGAAAAKRHPLTLLYEYLDMLTGHAKASLAQEPKGKKTCADEDQHPVRFLLATVPDPIDSHVAQSFDRAVDAIQGAMQDSGYLLDRFYLPWKRSGETRWTIGRPPENVPEAFLSVNPRSVSPKLHQSLPGTLLFRGRTPATPTPPAAQLGEPLVVVFLVGETPTSGVQREAMTSALNAIIEYPKKPLPCVVQDSKSPDIRILGPYFSGSTDSLHHLLWAWNQQEKKTKEIKIISGSATLDDNLEELTCDPKFDQACDQEEVSFHATVVPDGALTRTFLYRFLWRRLGVNPAEDVALFVEGGTAYGGGYKERSGGHLSPTRAAAPGALSTAVRLVVRFPLHVSQLRGAYEKENALQNPAPTGRAPRHALELALEAPEATFPDIVPAQDLRMTANIADLALTSGVETIRREGIRFVGIAASDPRDILFLARKIRESETNVTLFTFGSDVLYTHPDYQRYLRGMLVVTPYPLFSPNQIWTGAGPIRISFSGSSEQGIYNAVLALLHYDPKLSVRNKTALRANAGSLLEYRAPLTEGPPRPPIWVMAVGRRGFWPVWFTSTYKDKSGYVFSPGSDTLPAAPGPRPDYEERPPGASLAFILIETFFFVMLLLYFGTRFRWSRKNVHLPEPVRTLARLLRGMTFDILFSTWSDRTARGIRQAYRFVLFFLFALVQATLTAYLSVVRGVIARGGIAFGVALALFALLLLAASREYIEYYRHGRVKFRCALLFVVTLSATAPLAMYLAEVLGMPPEEKLALYGRTLDLTSTLSPVLPLVFGLAVVCLWAIANIRRGFYQEIYGNFQPPGEWRLKSLAGLRPFRFSIRKLLDDPVTRGVALLGPALALLPFYRVLLPDAYHTIDGIRWSQVFQAILLVCHFVIGYSFTLFVLLWLRLRRLLKRLSCLPIAEAFQRLPESVAATPWKMWRSVPSLMELTASVSQLRALVNLGRDRYDSLEKSLSDQTEIAESQLQKAFRKADEGLSESLPFQRALRRTMGRATVTILPALEEEWRKWPGPAGSIEDLEKKAEEQHTFNTPAWIRRGIPSGQEIWFRTAEEYVALRMSEFIRYVFLQMKNLLAFVFVGFFLELAVLNSYPFEPKRLVMALVWVAALVAIPMIAWVFINMDRDPILSLIGKTKPGHATFSMELVTSMMIYVVVPLVTLFATQFPEAGDIVFSIFNPAVKSLGK